MDKIEKFQMLPKGFEQTEVENRRRYSLERAMTSF